MQKKLNIGIIGLGRLGTVYARYFLGSIARANLVAVSDANEKVQQSFADENDIRKRYSDYRDMLADKEVEAVVIVTSTNTHKEIVIEAASQGKAVFCEKPLALSVADCEAMKDAVEKQGIFFHLGFMRRFDAGYAAAKQKIEEGVIGRPIVMRSSSRDPFRPSLEYLESSGGLFTDCGIHDIDLARWYMGEVRSVYGIGGNLAYPEMEQIGDVDNAIITLEFASGALGVIDLSRSGIYGYDIRTEILGTKGTLKIGYLRETPLMILTQGNVAHDTVPYFMERFGQAYRAQLQHFVDRVLSGQEPTVTCADGLAALNVTLAATQSYKEKHPVSL
jgi:scyllo-inositol 2-dehydrogenase (NAD+)